ncbi:glycoside hydrolase family 18 protein [Thozetella sp. PMI_491]|nr:glycoside hydrolase family 18 protein [Thozetella sp. PMI_491]
MPVEEVRKWFPARAKVLVAIGGWGDTRDFSLAAMNETSRQVFAANVARMVRQTGADGVDVDWEYPGGNGDDYKRIPNSEKTWEIAAYPLLLAELRAALGPMRILSAAVPGLPRDMLAFTRETIPRIMAHLDFLNVMTYDLMNRRDAEAKHHTSIYQSIEALDTYVASGAAPQNLNLGLAFYVKYFRTQHDECAKSATPLGCPTLLLEDPITGTDLGRAGAFSWHDLVPQDVASSFTRALDKGSYDEHYGGYSYWDNLTDLWWTFDTPDAVTRKVSYALDKTSVGGFFAWGLGEDAPRFEHLRALNQALEGPRVERDEL